MSEYAEYEWEYPEGMAFNTPKPVTHGEETGNE